jgi:hypothetical protein
MKINFHDIVSYTWSKGGKSSSTLISSGSPVDISFLRSSAAYSLVPGWGPLGFASDSFAAST